MSPAVATDGLHGRLAIATEGRTYKHLSDLTGVNAESVRRYMQGQPPTVEFVTRLCEGLGLNGDWLLLGSGPMRRSEVKSAALRSADPAELLGAMSGTMELLIERVDRLEVFVQTLETRLRAGRASKSAPTQTHADTDTTDARTGEAQDTEPAVRVKARRIGGAVAKRSRPDDG